MRQPIFILSVVSLVLLAGPAGAQFGSIFGGPPRPPADVPSRPPSRGVPPAQQPQDDDDDDDVSRPPPRLQPPPMSQPPQARPGAGSNIQTQPLSPIPGAQEAPAGQRPLQPPAQAAPSPQTTPGQNAPAQAGRPSPRGAPQQQAAPGAPTSPAAPAPAAPPNDEVVVAPTEQKLANPTAVFAGLDKITGRTITFDVAINETVQFGALQVTPRVCYTRPPTESAQTDSFVSVDEITLQGETRRIFNGWMFAASPGLNAVEHPIYDIWLSDCKGAQPAVAEVPPEPAKPQQQQRRQPTQQQRAPQRAQPNFLTPFR